MSTSAAAMLAILDSYEGCGQRYSIACERLLDKVSGLRLRLLAYSRYSIARVPFSASADIRSWRMPKSTPDTLSSPAVFSRGCGRFQSKTSRQKCVKRHQGTQMCPKHSSKRPKACLALLKAATSYSTPTGLPSTTPPEAAGPPSSSSGVSGEGGSSRTTGGGTAERSRGEAPAASSVTNGLSDLPWETSFSAA